MARYKKKRGIENNNISFQGPHCPLKLAGIKEIDYKDVELLKFFLTEKGKIMPRRLTGICSKNQKLLAKSIKRARILALISFSDGYIIEDEPVPEKKMK